MTTVQRPYIPAFPMTEGDWAGMDLRDYFAAKAMQGLLANPYEYKDEKRVCNTAYGMADAMMKARDSQ